ncbi:MAG: mandelate racemase/muconate lactonizing enzyme family protein [Deltaproteobacteria bacterium]|nr:mandelate racemase/muconate lactonizing enzyme family protein [Deltaproteobacteria bacterium]
MVHHCVTSAPICKAEIYVFRAPVAAPIRTSFGTMHDRPALILRLEDATGAYGWGEAWCNFPVCGAEHRARLLESVLIPHVLGKTYAHPEHGLAAIVRHTEVLRLQADEPGPLSQAAACVDIALWDLAARKADKPLHVILGQAGNSSLSAYASGINHPGIAETISRARNEGYRTFKVKIGFGDTQDMQNIHDGLDALREGERLAVDANQAWDLPTALAMIEKLNASPLLWIEEPLRCDRPWDEWKRLAASSRIPLAAGENMRSRESFETALVSRAFGVIQPDLCKWGGLSECRKIAAKILAAKLRYCPHYLGGGIGLLASAHLLAAAGGDGLLEVDCNPNPLRELLAQPFPAVANGTLNLSDAPGLGVEPDLIAVKDFMTFYKECRSSSALPGSN